MGPSSCSNTSPLQASFSIRSSHSFLMFFRDTHARAAAATVHEVTLRKGVVIEEGREEGRSRSRLWIQKMNSCRNVSRDVTAPGSLTVTAISPH